MKNTLLLFLVAISLIRCSGPSAEYLDEVRAYQDNQNQKFSNTETSPLPDEAIPSFHGLEYYPVNEDYRVSASFVLTPETEPFQMPTTTSRLVWYRKYAEAYFELDGQELVLGIYQNQEAARVEKYKNNLFLPFKDLSNAHGSYGGGRYIDLKIPDGENIIIDFNMSYNPYCAYNDRYSCPIPPEENHLNVEIPVGIKAYH